MAQAQAYQEMSKAPVEWEEKMKDGIVAVFRRWPTITLACDQEWAGNNTRNKINELLEEMFAILLNRKRKPMDPNESDMMKLAEFIRMTLYQKCNIELEDTSDQDVAMWSLRLLDTCRKNDYSLADNLMSQAGMEEQAMKAKLKQCKMEENIHEATEEDIALDEIINGTEDMDIDTIAEEMESNTNNNTNNMSNVNTTNPLFATGNPFANNQSSSSSSQNIPERRRSSQMEPEIDEDGFETVVKRKR